MTPQDYELSALRRKIDELEKELRKLKGIEEVNEVKSTPMTLLEILQVGCNELFDEAYRRKE